MRWGAVSRREGEGADRASAARIIPDRCLRGRRPSLACDRCRSACNAGAVSLASAIPEIATAACLGCGACVAACPTGAVVAAGFAPPPLGGPVLRIECARVPRHLRSEDGWTVPCHAGVTPSLLMAEAAQGAACRVEVIDRGWCRTCPAAGDASPAESLAARLEEAFVGAEGWSAERVEEPLDPALAEPAGTGPERNRRAVFRALLAGTPSPHRQGVLADRAARAALNPLAPVRPQITISTACADHGVCNAACPTGALRRTSDDEGRLTLHFAPDRCIECGRCAEVCPERALQLRTGATASVEPVLLREVTMAVCVRCETRFVAGDTDDAECPGCRKDAGLFHDLRRSLSRPAFSPASPAASSGAVASPSGGPT